MGFHLAALLSPQHCLGPLGHIHALTTHPQPVEPAPTPQLLPAPGQTGQVDLGLRESPDPSPL